MLLADNSGGRCFCSGAEWNRRCENAIILALHNRRMYRVKCVR